MQRQKVILYPYNKKFVKVFEEEKRRILKFLPNCEVHHIGSTAVPGLGGKGIIDILVALTDWKEVKEVIAKCRNLGFEHIHPKLEGRIFLSRVKETSFGDIHLHVVRKEGRPYKDLLLFRDYLRKHKKEAQRYFMFKKEWLKEYDGDRDYFRFAKVRYVLSVLSKAKSGPIIPPLIKGRVGWGQNK